MSEDQFCPNDSGCRVLSHTEECTRKIAREIVNSPDYMPLHKNLQELALLRSIAEKAERVAFFHERYGFSHGRYPSVGELAKALEAHRAHLAANRDPR